MQWKYTTNINRNGKCISKRNIKKEIKKNKNMNYIVVDVESDGPLQGINSMVCFGAVIVEEGLERTFYGKLKPVSTEYNPEALAISGFTRQQHEQFPEPKETMEKFQQWLKDNNIERPVLISDNNGYDASWINYYTLNLSLI
jgi:DNA polymerase III alpha subunit (gram-positive type)